MYIILNFGGVRQKTGETVFVAAAVINDKSNESQRRKVSGVTTETYITERGRVRINKTNRVAYPTVCFAATVV